MNKFNIEQIKTRLLLAKELDLKGDDIMSITEQSGGFINYLFKIETKKGLFFLKQFLKELKHESFKNLELGPSSRINLSYSVNNKFENVLGENSHIVPHIYFCDLNEGYLIMNGFENVSPLFNKLENGEADCEIVLTLAERIATIHQNTYINPNRTQDLYNNEWLGLKLKYQYYEMAKLLDDVSATILNNFADNYKNNKLVLTHGDFCSINILLDKENLKNIHIIDFEDAHIGTPAFDLGYFLSEFLIMAENFKEKRKEIFQTMKDFLDRYFIIFNKHDRGIVEKEVTIHAASLVLYRLFGLSKDIFTKHVNDVARSSLKNKAVIMINSNKSIKEFLR